MTITPSDLTTPEGRGINFNAKLKAYRIAIAKERNNLYKTTAFPENYGWEIINPSTSGGTITSSPSSQSISKNADEVLKVEVTLKVKDSFTPLPGVYTDNVTLNLGEGQYGGSQTIATTSKSVRTLEFKADSTNSGNSVSVSTGSTAVDVLSIKIYYK